MSTESATDMGVGLSLMFAIIALGGAAMTGISSYNYAIRHAQGLETSGLLANSGLAFGAAIAFAALAIVVMHAYEA